MTNAKYYICDECQTQRGYSKADYVENGGFINYYQCELCGFSVCLDCFHDHKNDHLKEIK